MNKGTANTSNALQEIRKKLQVLMDENNGDKQLQNISKTHFVVVETVGCPAPAMSCSNMLHPHPPKVSFKAQGSLGTTSLVVTKDLKSNSLKTSLGYT